MFFNEMSDNINGESFRYNDVIAAIKVLREKFDVFLYEGFRSGCAYCPDKPVTVMTTLLKHGFVGRQIVRVKMDNNNAGIENGYTYNKKSNCIYDRR